MVCVCNNSGSFVCTLQYTLQIYTKQVILRRGHLLHDGERNHKVFSVKKVTALCWKKKALSVGDIFVCILMIIWYRAALRRRALMQNHKSRHIPAFPLKNSTEMLRVKSILRKAWEIWGNHCDFWLVLGCGEANYWSEKNAITHEEMQGHLCKGYSPFL